jgi:hypothetical protein
MSYTITDTDTGATQIAADRDAAIRALGELGLNIYAAVQMLDAADGLAPLNIRRSITVTRARRVVDFYLDGSPVYDD